MRILVLCEGDAETWDSWSGTSRSLLDHLRAEGHTVACGDVDLYGIPKLVTALRCFSPHRSRWWSRYHLLGSAFKARTRQARRVLAQHEGQFDVILQIGATFRIDPPAGVPYVLYCDSNIEQAQDGIASGMSEVTVLRPDEIRGVKSRETEVYAGAARIFTMSHRLAGTFAERFGIPEERLETVHAGPNFPEGRAPEVPDRTEERGPIVLFIGRAFERKGGDLLLEAFRRVREEIPAARLIIIGPDADSVPVPDDSGVELLGFVDKGTPEGEATIADAYARARVFCLPTRYEPFGVVFLEAMHFELPCIGPNQWAVPEIIEDGVTGLLAPPGDARAFAAAMTRLLSNPEEASRMGAAGKRRMEERFTWPRVARRMSASLEKLTG